MPTERRCEANPFESPIKPVAYNALMAASGTKAPQPDVLCTANLLLEQLKEIETLCSTVEERVQHKRQALKELEYLVLGSNTADGSPRSPVCPTNTPINPRLRTVSPRLRGLFDLHGPGQVNFDSMQSCLDYSPEMRVEDNLSAHEGQSEEWADDDEEALLSPFDDKYAYQETPQARKVEKDLPAIPREVSESLESRIPRKVYVRKENSVSRRQTGRSSGTAARSYSHRRHPNLRGTKTSNPASGLTSKGTMRRGSWKRSIAETARTKGEGKAPHQTIENASANNIVRKKEKRKGLWSIYSVCSEISLSARGGPHAV